MSCFKNILVGIDLSHCARLAPDALTPGAREVFRRSVWLAQRTSGKLTLAHEANSVLGGIPKRILRNSSVTCFRL